MELVNATHNLSTDNLTDGNSDGSAMDTTAILYISAEVINGVVSVLGNILVVAAILKTPSLHTVTNVFIVSLAIADVFVGFLVAPVAVSVYKSFPVDFYICLLLNTVILMFTNVSILMLLAVAVERFIAISRPFTYVRLMTVRRAILINGLVWLLGILLGLTPMYGWHKDESGFSQCAFVNVIGYDYMVYFQFFGLVVLPLLIMLVIYTYILRVVHHHTSRDSRHNSLFNERTHKQRRKEFKKDVKAAKYFALIILLFAIFWLPINIMNTISHFWPHVSVPLEVLLTAIVLSHANSSINPFLYAASNSRIKGAMKTVLHLNKGREDGENTDLPRDLRPSTASQDENVSAGRRSVSYGLMQADLALPYPFTKSHGKSQHNGKEDRRSLGTLSPPLILNPSTLPDANHHQHHEMEGYVNGRSADHIQEMQPIHPPENTQDNNVSLTIIPNTDSLTSSSQKQSKNLINGYLKHNQVHPSGEADHPSTQDDSHSITKDLPTHNGHNVTQTGYQNLAFCPDDADESELIHSLAPTTNITGIPETQPHPSPHTDADISSNHSSTQAHNDVSRSRSPSPSPSGDSLQHRTEHNGTGSDRFDPEGGRLDHDIASAIQKLDEITTLEHATSSEPVFHKRDNCTDKNIDDGGNQSMLKENYEKVETETEKEKDDEDVTVLDIEDEITSVIEDSKKQELPCVVPDHETIKSINSNLDTKYCKHCDTEAEIPAFDKHSILINISTQSTKM